MIIYVLMLIKLILTGHMSDCTITDETTAAKATLATGKEIEKESLSVIV